MTSRRRNEKKKIKTKKLFFSGGAEKITLGSMRPIIKSLLVKNRNLSYYLEYINYRLSKENDTPPLSGNDHKMKATDVDSVLQTFSVAINIIETKKEETKNSSIKQQQEQQPSTAADDDDDDESSFMDCIEENGFCVLPKDRVEVTRKYFEEIKGMIETYISVRNQKIYEKLADDENNQRYTTILKNLMNKLFSSVLKKKPSEELVSVISVTAIPLAPSLQEAEAIKSNDDISTVDAVLLTEVETTIINEFNTFSSTLAQDLNELSVNLSVKISELLQKVHNGVHLTTLLDLNKLLIDHVGTYIEVFVSNNVNDYKGFIETIFLKVERNSSIFNAVLSCNTFIQNFATKLILNKELTEMFVKSLGTSFDVVNLISLISFTNLTLSGGLISSILDPSIVSKGTAAFSNLLEGTLAADYTKIYNDDTNLKKDGFLFLADQLVKVNDPTRFAKSRINSLISNVTGILYKNSEMVKNLNEKKESGEQLLNVVLSWNKTISETAFKGISFSHSGDKLWSKLEASTILRQFNPDTEEVSVNTNLTKIYSDYDNIIKEVNGIICKIRCVESFLPVNETLLFFIPDEKFQNFDEEEIALLLQYVIKKNEFIEVNNTIKSLTDLTNLIQNEISKEASMREFIKVKIYEVANIDEDCNETRPEGIQQQQQQQQQEDDNFWSWGSIKKTVQDVAQFAIDGKIEGKTPDEILALEDAKFNDLSLFSSQKGGTIIDKRNKEIFYQNLCTIIYNDWRMTNLVETDAKIDNLTELLSNCLAERLAAYKLLKQMGLIEVKCFESVLRKLSVSVVQSVKDEYNKLETQTINEENFLYCILELLCNQRVKLCVELFSKYYDTEGYKIYKQQEVSQFKQMWTTYKGKALETLSSTTITYGWKATQFIVNVLSKAQDLKASAAEKFHKYFFTNGGGTRRRRRTHKKRKRKTMKHTKTRR